MWFVWMPSTILTAMKLLVSADQTTRTESIHVSSVQNPALVENGIPRGIKIHLNQWMSIVMYRPPIHISQPSLYMLVCIMLYIHQIFQYIYA